MDADEERELRDQLTKLKQEHHDVHIRIDELLEESVANQLELGRLKKQKLALKDEISKIEDKLLPDIIA